MHDWGDEDCIKILKNCRKAIPQTGRMIIVEVVLDSVNGKHEKKTGLDPNLGLASDLLMVAHTSGGKERTEEEWKKILCEAGFGSYNIFGISSLQSVIEVFPQ